jgi:hypothetical protein
MMYDPTSTEELGKWRQRMRDNRAESLWDYRKYKREWGAGDAVAMFHFGMAGGYNVALIHIDHLVRCAKAKEILGMEELS